MASEDVTIKRHTGNVADLENEMCGIDDTAHAFTGVKHFHYKDIDGNAHQIPNLDEKARFTDLEVTGVLTVPSTLQTTFYVSTSGSDATGDGTSGNPYATIEKCLTKIPDTIPNGIRVTIRINNGTYTSFPSIIKRTVVGSGSILICRNETPVDVIAGPFTVSSATYPTHGADVTLSVAGTPFADDAIRTSVGGVAHVRMLTGAASGHILEIHRNTTSSLICLNSITGITAGDTFKIIEPGVIFKTTGRHVFDIDGDQGYSAFMLDGIAFESSFSEYAYVTPNPAYTIIGSAGVGIYNCTFRTESDKAYTLCVGSASINQNNPSELSGVPYYADISAALPYGDAYFYLHQSFSANAMSAGLSATTFAQHVGPFLANGAEGIAIYRTGSSVSGLCSRNIVYAEGRMLKLSNCMVGLFLAQYGITYVEAISTYTHDTYSVKVEKDSQLTLYSLHTMHSTQKDCAVWLNHTGKIPICENIIQDTPDDYIFQLGFSCIVELTAALSVNGALGDIFFTRGQTVAAFPAVGGSVTDYENSFVAVAGSTAVVANSLDDIPDGVTYVRVTETQRDFLENLLNPSVRIIYQDSTLATHSSVVSGDRNNVIYFQVACGESWVLVVPNSILAIEGFCFYVRVAPGQPYGTVRLSYDDGSGGIGSTAWDLLDDPADTQDIMYQVIISGGNICPIMSKL